MEGNIQDLEKSCMALEEELGISLTIHDLTGAFRDERDEKLLSDEVTTHRHPACRVGRNEWYCLMGCLGDANELAREKEKPCVHVCWKGIAEVVVPVIRNNVHMANLFAGPFLPCGKKNKVKRHDGLPKKFKKIYKTLSVLDKKREEALGNILSVFGQGLLARMEEIRCIAEESGDRGVQIRRFLVYRLHSVTRLDDLAKALHLSPSRTSHVVKDLFGMSFRQLVLREKLARARHLLLNTGHPVGQVARLAGFKDEYHFNSTFKKEYGLPPGRYRRKHRK